MFCVVFKCTENLSFKLCGIPFQPSVILVPVFTAGVKNPTLVLATKATQASDAKNTDVDRANLKGLAQTDTSLIVRSSMAVMPRLTTASTMIDDDEGGEEITQFTQRISKLV